METPETPKHSRAIHFDDSGENRPRKQPSTSRDETPIRRLRPSSRSKKVFTGSPQDAPSTVKSPTKRKRGASDENKSPPKRFKTSSPKSRRPASKTPVPGRSYKGYHLQNGSAKFPRRGSLSERFLGFQERTSNSPEIILESEGSGQSDQESPSLRKMGPIKENSAKRKATEEPSTPSDNKRLKSSNSDSPEPRLDAPPKGHIVSFPEKPAEAEERLGEIEFRVVNNDNQRESLIILTGLKNIFQKQLPKMPKDYIARLVYDRTHLSMAIVKHPLEVVGGITYRPFKGRQFAEIVFCAISSDQQVKGYGAHLMSHLKDYVKATSDVMHFLTYADNYAIGYFKKQGFTKEITLERSKWMGYIKDYEGGTIMQCSMLDRVRYLETRRMLLKQKEAVHAKIRAFSKSHEIHPPPKEWANGVHKIDPMSIPAIKASGWSPDMDELARQPRHGPNYNQLLHLLNDMQNHASAWPFQHPVNREEVADYYEVIKEPMDLSTMEIKLEADNYQTPEDFVRDAKLIFDNCRKYNNETTPYAKCANKLEKFMWQQIKAIPEWSHLEP